MVADCIVARRLGCLACMFLVLAVGREAAAQVTSFEPGDIVLDYEVVLDTRELDFPVYATHAGDGSGRLFVVDQPGSIHVLQNEQLLPAPFLDITAETVSTGPRGMLGMAFHPGFADDQSPGHGKLYTFHTTTPSGGTDFPSGASTHHSVVTEWQVDAADANRVDPASRREIMRIGHFNTQHSGGMLLFDESDYMHIAVGDPTAGHGQNLSNPQGSILRIDPLDPSLTAGSSDPVSGNEKYRIPSHNPFLDTEDAIDEIFAHGFRNPWRFSFDRETGMMFEGDVGEGAREEVNVIVAGGNYGWGLYEGTLQRRDPPAGAEFEWPLAEYTHAAGRSITGGYVYRGTAIPWLEGIYVFGDFTQDPDKFLPPGTLLHLDPYDENGDIRDPQDVDLREITFVGGKSMGQLLTSFAEDEQGELYMVGLGGGNRAQIRRLIAGPAPLAGDYNGNGLVEQADLDLVLSNWGADGSTLPEGWINDLPEGTIDQAELDAVLTGWGSTYPQFAAGAIPEPATLWLLLGCLLALGAIRHRGQLAA